MVKRSRDAFPFLLVLLLAPCFACGEDKSSSSDAASRDTSKGDTMAEQLMAMRSLTRSSTMQFDKTMNVLDQLGLPDTGFEVE